METVEELESRREALQKTLSTGALVVRHGDKSVQYRSADEIERAISMLDRRISKRKGRKRRGVFYIAADRGL